MIVIVVEHIISKSLDTSSIQNRCYNLKTFLATDLSQEMFE